MTPALENNCTSSDKSLPNPAARSPARSAMQAKAQPSLRIYDNNGNVIGYWTSRNLVSPVTRNLPT